MDVRAYDAIESLAGEWDELADRADAPPWLRPGWISAWWEAFGSGELVLLGARRDGRLVGVLPLESAHGLLRSTANWHTPEFGLLGDDADARRALAEAALARRPRRLELAFVSPGGLAEVRGAGATAGYRVEERVVMRSPFVRVEGTVDAYLSERGPGKKRRKEITRSEAKLAEQGTLLVDVADGRERLDELLTEGLPVEASGWKAESGTAIVSTPETHRFYAAVARWAAARGMLRLFFLRIDGRPIAFEFTLDDGRRLYDIKGGYDKEFRSFSPGFVVAGAMIAYAHEHGRESFEFLGSEEPFKSEWAKESRERVLLQAFAPTLAGRAERAVHVHGRPLAKRVLARVRR